MAPPLDLAALRQRLIEARTAYPDLRRDIGRTIAAIERRQQQALDTQRTIETRPTASERTTRS